MVEKEVRGAPGVHALFVRINRETPAHKGIHKRSLSHMAKREHGVLSNFLIPQNSNYHTVKVP
jgi:hypothetical protein